MLSLRVLDAVSYLMLLSRIPYRHDFLRDGRGYFIDAAHDATHRPCANFFSKLRAKNIALKISIQRINSNYKSISYS
jgi:hypothetical protein